METASSADRSQITLRHRRQVFWQIVFPVVLAAAGGVFLVVILSLAAINGSSASTQWASIAIIWMIIPLLVAGVFLSIILAGLIYLVALLSRKLPTFTHLVHTYVQIIGIRFGILLDRVARPQITALGRWAAVKAVFKSLWRIGERH